MCRMSIFFIHCIRLQKRLYVVIHISAANRKVRLTLKNYFPREGEKFLSRGRKKIPVMYLVDRLRVSHR